MYSLYHLIFDYTAWETQFNCSFIDVNSIPLHRRQKHWLVAYVTIVLCVIIYLLYIPCMYSLWKQQKDGNPCYRILLYCGVMDFGILWSLGILAPILSLNGSIFCTDPLITFITGATNDFFYSCEMIAGVLLALNRCLDILCTEITQMLFDGKNTKIKLYNCILGNKVWIWLGIITIYGLYWLLFVNPSLFTSIYFAYFFNPFQGYIDADQYHPLTHTLHDWLIGISVPVIYILFLIGIRWKMRGAVGGLGITRLQMMTFIQVFILCLIHLVGCSIYVLMQVIPVTESLIILAQFVWFINHGISPFIFLCINRTVRNDCILLFYKIYDPSRITQAHGITVLRSVGGGVPIQSGSQRSAAVTKVSPGILPPVVGNRERDRF